MSKADELKEVASALAYQRTVGAGSRIAELEKEVEYQTQDCKKWQEMYKNRCEEYRKLEKEIKLLGERCNQLLKDKGDLTDKVTELEQQIKKMRCCQNCKHTCCSWSYEGIKEGVSMVHLWNEEKKAYCDVGEGAEYQLWEMRK